MAFAGLLGVPTGSTLAQLIRHKVSKRKIIIFLMVYSTSRKYTAIVQNKQIGKCPSCKFNQIDFCAFHYPFNIIVVLVIYFN
jgi:ribose 5-phosphate isomerase